MQSPIIEVDVHGLTADQAVDKVETIIKKADRSTYRFGSSMASTGGTISRTPYTGRLAMG
ncbi:MAG: hypothetical protein LUD14_04225 [Clostridiales bacterium]|nr:hypothetical protein [Clostridiales bacterium]